MSKKIKIICVVGPTACGKTKLGVEIAKALDGEVISADSMQIYKGMHIASAAADPGETEGIPHHLTEFLPYGESFTVYDWVKCAREKITEIASRGKVPIIVGGTGLYINCLVDNIELTETKTDFALRKSLQERAKAEGGEKLLAELKEIDPEYANKLHANDTKRIIRALEIYKTTGLNPTQQNKISKRNKSPYTAVIIGMNYKDRSLLYDRINRRVDLMVEAGLLEEAKKAFLLQSNKTDGAVQAIGHKELFPYFKGETTLEEALNHLKQSSRRYAKRQITWFGARDDVNFVYPDCDPDILKTVLEIIERQ